MDIQSTTAGPKVRTLYKLDNGLPSRIVVGCFERAFKAAGRRTVAAVAARRGGHWPLTAGVGAAWPAARTPRRRWPPPAAARRRQGHPGRPDRGRPGRQRRHPARARATTPSSLPQARRGGQELGEARARRRAADLQLRRLPQPGGPQGVRQAGGRAASASPRSTRSTRRSRSSAPAACEFDVIFSTPDQLSRLVGRELIQPLNFELIPNLQKNVWPELHSPFYDVGPRYSVPYTVYTTGIALAQRHARLRPEQARPAVGRVLVAAGREVPRQGRRSSTTRARRRAWRSCAAA